MARYYTSQLVKPISQYAPALLKYIDDTGEYLQKQQDAYRVNIEGLNKETDALSNDLPNVIQEKKNIEGKFNELRMLNYNDPLQRQQALKGAQEIQKKFSPFELVGAADIKRKEYDALQTNIAKIADKDPLKAGYLSYKAKQLNLTPERAIKIDPNTGVPINREVIPPVDFEYKDPTKYFQDFLKSVESDEQYQNSGLRQSVIKYKLSLTQGKVNERSLQDIYNAFIPTASADFNLIESAKAIQSQLGPKDQFGNPIGVEEQENFFKQEKDKEGNVYLKPNTNTVLGRTIFGIAEGGQFRKEDFKQTFEEETFARNQAEKNVSKGYSNTFSPGETLYDPEQNKFAGVEIKDLFKKDRFTGEDKLDLSVLQEKLVGVSLSDYKNGILKALIEPGSAIHNFNTGQWQNKIARADEIQKAFNKIPNIAKANGLDVDVNGNKTNDIKIITENVLRFLQNLNVSNKSIATPPTSISKNINEKIDSDQFNTNLMVDKLSGKTFNEDRAESGGKKAITNFVGWDLSEKDNPKFRMAISPEGGSSTIYKSYSIPNDSYKDYLNKSTNFISDINEKTANVSKRKPDEIKEASNIRTKLISNPDGTIDLDKYNDLVNEFGIKDITDLVPLSINVINGEEVSNYLKKGVDGKVTGEVVSITVHNDGTASLHPSTTEVVDNTLKFMTTLKQFSDIAPK